MEFRFRSAAGVSLLAVAAAISMTVNTPALGVNNPVTGSVSGLPLAANQYKIGILVSGDGGNTWWDKTHDYPNGTPQAVVTGIPLNNDYTFTITGWVSDPNDLQAGLMRVIVVPQSFSFLWPGYQVEGVAYPNSLTTATVASYTINRGTGTVVQTPGGGAAASPTAAAASPNAGASASPAAAGGTPTIAINGFPLAAMADIGGTVSGLVSPTKYKAALYVLLNNTWWGPKPHPWITAPLSSSSTFTIANWNSDPGADAAVQNYYLAVFPNSETAPTILGGQIPVALTKAQVASSAFSRTGQQAAPTAQASPSPLIAPTPSPAASPSSAAGPTVAWPPSNDPGAKTTQQGGFINFAGYRWAVKDSNGGRVGPGPNVFSNSANNVWTDSWGLHLNVWPQNGCGGWTSSEVILDHTLGYGTYLFRYVSPVENLDPDITWSPFFLWDDSGNAGNGYREVDFEVARWGNAGDPTSSQFVLRPLQSNGMVPGWRVRYETKAMSIWQGTGDGSGNCNNNGQTDFNGAAVSKVTCAVRWFAGKLAWYCADGFYTLQTLAQVPASKISASYVYQHPEYVPDIGDTRVHINHWIQNGQAPRWGRRSHGIIAGFEFTANDMSFPNFVGDQNIEQRFLLQRGLQQSSGAASQSSGDPSGEGIQLTMLGMQANNRQLFAKSTATAKENNGMQISGLVAGAALFGGLIGMATMFFAGYTIARRGGGAPIDYVKRAIVGTPRASHGTQADQAPVVTTTRETRSKVAPFA